MRLCNTRGQVKRTLKLSFSLFISTMKIGLTVIHPSDQMVSTLVIVAKQGEAFFSLLLSPRFFKRLDQKAKNKNASLRLSFKEPLR